MEIFNQTSESSSVPEVSLEKCFQEIIDGKSLDMDIHSLNIILSKTLGINLNYLKPRLKYILPYMLVHFITSWPGWKKTSHYKNKQITFENWFKKFKEYLIFKINFLIKNDYDKSVAMIRNNCADFEQKVVDKTDCGMQTNPNIEKVMAPFSIEISGPAKVLNSLVFCEGPDDAVLVREYRVNSLWDKPLNVRQLINWTCTEVEFKSKHLHFKRTNQHHFKRYLTFSTEKSVFKSDNFIDDIDIIDEKTLREAYTLNAIKEYCNAYIKFLRSQLKLSPEIQKEIEIILEDFVFDIVDINMNSIATNTSVCYNIGNAIYARNKSIKTSQQAICFGECLTPKLNLSLYSFTGVEDQQIVQFDTVTSDNIVNLCPSIIYRCTFCTKNYNRCSELWTHLQNSHIMEQPVLCFKCRQQFEISNLSENRWFHDCRPRDDVSEGSSSP